MKDLETCTAWGAAASNTIIHTHLLFAQGKNGFPRYFLIYIVIFFLHIVWITQQGFSFRWEKICHCFFIPFSFFSRFSPCLYLSLSVITSFCLSCSPCAAVIHISLCHCLSFPLFLSHSKVPFRLIETSVYYKSICHRSCSPLKFLLCVQLALVLVLMSFLCHET